MAWYREWFGEEYLELYANRDENEASGHVDFVEKALGGPGGQPRPRAVLDLACGAGRHTAVLRRRGYRALGVDLSITLLIRGQMPCVAGDMRRLIREEIASGATLTISRPSKVAVLIPSRESRRYSVSSTPRGSGSW